MANDLKGIPMPELIIYEFLKIVNKIVKDDFAANAADETKSLLYILFSKDRIDKDNNLETFNYFHQAKQIILKDGGIQINIGYNTEKAQMGCIHIMMPSESGEPLGIGADEGYQNFYEHTSPNPDNPEQQQIDALNDIYTASFSASYNLIISSESSLEAVVIYHFIRACFISLYDHLELYGLQNVTLGGSDIQMQTNMVPTNLYHRSLIVAFKYEVSILKFYKEALAKKFKLTGIILE